MRESLTTIGLARGPLEPRQHEGTRRTSEVEPSSIPPRVQRGGVVSSLIDGCDERLDAWRSRKDADLGSLLVETGSRLNDPRNLAQFMFNLALASGAGHAFDIENHD